jgi:CubicO group peptidase (beta-lactamase class C family)
MCTSTASRFVIAIVLLLGFTAWSLPTWSQSTPRPSPSLIPVAQFKQDLPVELSYRLRQGFGFPNAYYALDANLYYNLHWEEFVPHNTVRREGEVRPIPSAINGALGQVSASSSLGQMTLDALIDDSRSRMQSFIVVHKGTIVYERYPGMQADDHHLWYSTAKSIAGLLVGLLEADGFIDVSKPIDVYLPELAATHWQGIPVIDILDMASGLDLAENDGTRFNAAHSVGQFFRIELGEVSGVDGPTSDEILFQVDAKRAPGEIFEYSSLNTKLLGLLVERVSGRRLADFFSERVWSKLGAEGDALFGLNPWGGVAIYSWVSTRLRDMARYGMLFTPSWNVVAVKPVVPTSLLDKIRYRCRPEIYQRGVAAGTVSRVAEKHCNSRQWDVVFDDGDMYKGGARGQGLYVSPSRDLVVAWFSTTRESGWMNYARSIAKTLVINP